MSISRETKKKKVEENNAQSQKYLKTILIE